MVDVTTEALKMVKDSLSNFLTDVEGVASRADNRSNEIVNSCRTQVNQAKNDVFQSEARITALTNEISQAEEKIQSTTNEISSITTRMPQVQSRIRSLDSQIMDLESQIHNSRAQLSNCADPDQPNCDAPDQRDQIQSQIDMLQNRVSQCRSEQQSLENELRNLENKKSQLQQQLNAIKSQESQLESERSTEKNRCNKLREKLERLKTAFGRVESDLRAYVSAAKNFETSSADSTQKKVSAVEKCIASIEEYERVSLGSVVVNSRSEESGTHSSGPSYSPQVMTCSPGEYHYESGGNNSRHAYGQLHLVAQGDRHRNQSAQSAAGDTRRREDDDGGHLIGARFGGASTSENLFPQNRHLNRAGYRALENEWAGLLDSGNQVYVDVYTSASNNQMREDSIYGSYTVISPNGEQYTDTFSFANENTETQEAWEEDVFINNQE